jgi:hypothetical protein
MTEAAPQLALPLSQRLNAPARAWLRDNGHIPLAIAGSIAFMIVRPPVADLQAADARASAASRHVGLGYWLSWFGGSTPGQYSVLTPAVAAIIGVTTLAALATVAVALLARPLLTATPRRHGAAYLAVASALANLWCGRVPFAVSIAISLLGLPLLLRNRPVLGGLVNGFATFFSPLGPTFILLALAGPLITRKDWRPALVRFGIPSVIGLVLPSLYFGAPSPMPFPWTTLAWCVGIIAAVSLLRLPRYLQVSVWLSLAGVLIAFVVPTGMGSNISRYAFLVLPPIIWALARNPRRVVALALVPAFVYSGYLVLRDITAAAQPSAQQTYYAALRQELGTLPGINNHRVEVLDTTTHRASVELIPTVYLARGWETQNDATNNQIFYDVDLLNANSYRQWLDDNAVSWVAVPTAPGPPYQAEAALIHNGLGYLTPIWRDAQWTLYSVSQPQPIIPFPAHVVSSNETEVVFTLDRPAVLDLRLRPTKFVKIVTSTGAPAKVCLTSRSADQIQASLTTPGTYMLTSGLLVSSAVNRSGC